MGKIGRPKVSLVAPAYENPESLGAFLETLQKQCHSEKYEVIVVDDASRRGDLRKICARFSGVRFLRLRKNLGPSGSRNAGAKAARGEILFFADSDSLVMSNVVRLARQFLKSSGFDAVIGAPDPFPANPGLFSDFWALVKSECLPRSREGGSFYPAVGAIRRSVFWKVGGFDENLRSLEDFEFSDRLKREGVSVGFERRMRVRFFYPPFSRNLRQSFSRAGKWMVLRWGKVAFDRHTTTSRQAAGMVLGAGVIPLGIVATAGAIPWFCFGALALAYLAVVWPFLDFCRKRKGWFYVPTAAVLHMLLAIAVTAGVARAVIWRITQAGPPEEFLSTRDA